MVSVVCKDIFDTSAESTVNSPLNRFASLVRSQQDGAIIVIAMKDEGVDHLCTYPPSGTWRLLGNRWERGTAS